MSGSISTATPAASTDLMTPDQAAAELAFSVKTLANQRSRRVGAPYIRLSGGAIRYSRKAVRAWLEANTVTHGDAA